MGDTSTPPTEDTKLQTPLEQRRALVQEDIRRMLLLGSKDATRPMTRDVRYLQQLSAYTFVGGLLLGGLVRLSFSPLLSFLYSILLARLCTVHCRANNLFNSKE